MNILLTGATGFIGTNFVSRLHNKYNIVALVRQNSNVEKIGKYCKVYYDDGSIESILHIFTTEKIQGVVHLAAYVTNLGYKANQISDILMGNINFGVRILESIKHQHIDFFINATTSDCYCNSNAYLPASIYAATKKAFEDIMLYYALITDCIFSNLLFLNAYGPHNEKYLLAFLQKISKTNEELLMSDGSQIVDYSHVFDIVDGFDCLIELIQENPEFCKNKIFSLKGKERQTLKEVVTLYEKVLGKKLNIKWGARPLRELEIMTPWEGGETLPNWKQKITLQEGFKMMINAKKYTGGGAE